MEADKVFASFRFDQEVGKADRRGVVGSNALDLTGDKVTLDQVAERSKVFFAGSLHFIHITIAVLQLRPYAMGSLRT